VDVVLRPTETVVTARAISRGLDALTDPEPIRHVYREFSGIGPYERHVIDSSRLTARNRERGHGRDLRAAHVHRGRAAEGERQVGEPLEPFQTDSGGPMRISVPSGR
jgi:hypothetical protein